MKISILLLMIIPIILLTSFADAGTFDVSFFKGHSYNDKNDSIYMEFFNNTLSGQIIYNSQTMNFEDLPVTFYKNSFKVRDSEHGFIIRGNDLLHGNDITIVFTNPREIETFKIFEREEVIIAEDRVDILEKFEKYFETITNDSLLESLQNVEEWQQQMNVTNIPTHDYSNDINVIQPETDSFLMSINFVNFPDTKNLNSELDLKVQAKNIRNNTYLDGADITVKIIDEGFVLFEWNDIINEGGYAFFNTDIIYPIVYPFHRIIVEATVSYGNYTSTYSDSFCVEVPDLEYWEDNVDLEYADSNRFDWLPFENTKFPREPNSYDDCD